jgi:hypothetical protein
MNNLRILVPALAGLALAVGGVLPAAAGPTTVAVDDGAQTQPGMAVTIAVLANDTPADGFTLGAPSVAAPPTNGTVAFDASNNSFVYTPADGFTGSDSFTYSVCDNEPEPTCAQATVDVIVAASTPAPATDTGGLYPYASGYQLDVQEGQSTSVNVLSNDSAGAGELDPASLKIITQPADGSATLNADGTLSYTPGSGFTGADSLVYQVCNTEATDPPSCDDGKVSITVDQPPAPAASPTTVPTQAPPPPPQPTAEPATPPPAATVAPLPPSTGNSAPTGATGNDPWLLAAGALAAGLAASGALYISRRR